MKNLLFCLFCNLSLAQVVPLEWAEIPAEDLATTEFPADRDAPAMVLGDVGKTELNGVYKMIFKQHTRIKIFNQDGFKFGNVNVRFLSGPHQKVTNIEGYTYHQENGSITAIKLEKDGIFKEKLKNGYELVRFTLPALKPGCIIEYRYTLQLDRITLPSWTFQWNIPNRYSQYNVVLPTFLKYELLAKGSLPLVLTSEETHNKGSQQISSRCWVMKQIPALRAEPQIASLENHRSLLQFQISRIDWSHQAPDVFIENWSQLHQRLSISGRFGQQLNPNSFIRKKAKEWAGTGTPRQQLEQLFKAYTAAMTLNNVYGVRVSQDVDKAIKAGSGSISELSLGLVACLRAIELEAYPLLLSTRDHGFVDREVPHENQFNYVVALVLLGENFVLLDPSSSDHELGTISLQARNGGGWLLNGDEGVWLNLEDYSERTKITLNGVLDDQGNLSGQLSWQDGEYTAMALRRDEEAAQQARSWLRHDLSALELTDITVATNPVPASTPSRSLSFSSRNMMGKKIYLDLMLDSEFVVNPFTARERLLPISMDYQREWLYVAKIQIPEGYRLAKQASKTRRAPDPNLFFKQKVSQEGNKLNFVVSIKIIGGHFPANEYDRVRNFYSELADQLTTPIVLEKTAPTGSELVASQDPVQIVDAPDQTTATQTMVPQPFLPLDDTDQSTVGVIHDHHQVFRVDAADSAMLEVHFKASVLNEKGRHLGSLVVAYDPFSKISDINFELLDKNGKTIKKLKNSQIKDWPIIGQSFADDYRLKSAELYHDQYPYTVVYSYRKKYDGLLSWRTWSPLLPKVAIEKSSFSLELMGNESPRYLDRGLGVEAVTSQNGHYRRWSWQLENLNESQVDALLSARFQPDLITAPNNFEIDGHAGSMQSWSEFGSWYHNLNQGRQDLSPQTLAQIDQLLTGVTEPNERARVLYQFLQQKVRYVSVQLGIGGWRSADAMDVDKRGLGDCKALTNYMLAMLQHAKVEAYPALINNGLDARPIDPEFPVNMFNHVIICMPGASDDKKEPLFLECTSQVMPFGQIGGSNADRYALLVRPTGSQLLRTPRHQAEENTIEQNAQVTLNAQGDGEAKLQLAYSGTFIGGLRSALVDKGPLAQQRWLSGQLDIANFQVSQIHTQQLSGDPQLAKISSSVSLPRYARKLGSQLQLMPNLTSRLIRVNSIDKDQIPHLFEQPAVYRDKVVYQLGGTWKPTELPPTINHSLPFASYRVVFSFQDQSLLYERVLTIHRKVGENELQELTDFIAAVADADHTKLLLTQL